MIQQPLETVESNHVDLLLAEAQDFTERGQRERAYQLSLEATQIAPRDVDAWLLRADTAASLEEKLVCLSRLNAIDPNWAPARERTYSALKDLLQQEPFLAYIDETDDLYRVKSGLELYLNVPKARAVPETYPAPKSGALHSTYRWLSWSLLGLFIGGIGAIFLAPIAGMKVFWLLLKPLTRRDRVRALVAMVAAVLIWLAALPLGFLFYIHIVQ